MASRVASWFAASRRLRTPNFCSIAETWWSTVRVETTRRCAISALEMPVLSIRRISI